MNNKENFREESKGMTLRDLVFQIRKNLVVFIAIIALFMIAGIVYGTKFKQIVYTASATTIVQADSNNTKNKSSEYSDYIYATYLIHTFEDYMKSDLVIEQTLKTLKNKNIIMTGGEIKQNIKITSKQNSLVMDVDFKSDDKDKAVEVVNALVDATIYATQLRRVDDPATPEDESKEYVTSVLANKLVSINEAKTAVGSRGTVMVVIISLILGIISAFAFVLLKFITNDTYTSREEFENQFGIDVLSSIPEIYVENGESK